MITSSPSKPGKSKKKNENDRRRPRKRPAYSANIVKNEWRSLKPKPKKNASKERPRPKQHAKPNHHFEDRPRAPDHQMTVGAVETKSAATNRNVPATVVAMNAVATAAQRRVTTMTSSDHQRAPETVTVPTAVVDGAEITGDRHRRRHVATGHRTVVMKAVDGARVAETGHRGGLSAAAIAMVTDRRRLTISAVVVRRSGEQVVSSLDGMTIFERQSGQAIAVEAGGRDKPGMTVQGRMTGLDRAMGSLKIHSEKILRD